MNSVDNRIWSLLWFLCEPEDSTKSRRGANARRAFTGTFAAANLCRETVKTAAWIMVSIVLAMTLAQLS